VLFLSFLIGNNVDNAGYFSKASIELKRELDVGHDAKIMSITIAKSFI